MIFWENLSNLRNGPMGLLAPDAIRGELLYKPTIWGRGVEIEVGSYSGGSPKVNATKLRNE